MSPNSEDVELEVVKHPLEREWSFWLFTNKVKSKKNWHLNLKELTHFDTVEDYWCLYHHTKLPSQLVPGQDYAVFTRHTSPTWEHPANRAGGRWLLGLERRQDLLDACWLDTVLLMIGENFGDSNKIVCGAVVNVRDRNRSKVAIWTNTTEEAPNMTIGRIIKEQLKIKHIKLQYYKHDSTQTLYSC